MRRAKIVGIWCMMTILCGALLLAGIDKLRASANQMKCRNNLRQIELAIANYHDTFNRFPAGTVANPELPPDRRLSWMFEIDPFVHARMDPTWNRHSTEAWDSAGNLALQRGRMPWYECPPGTTNRQLEPLGNTNYVGAAGIGPDAAWLSKSDPSAGVFGYDRRISQSDLTDGVSYTILIIETLSEIGPWVAGGRPTVRELLPDSLPLIHRKGQFGGQHRGGVMAALADGSVRFICSSVERHEFEALFTIAGGESHASPWVD